MKYLVIFFTLLSGIFSAQNTQFEEKVSEIKAKLTEKNIQIFAEINHSEEAKKVGLELPKTIVLIVGNPKVGTLLMQENKEFALHLPLKILITEEKKDMIIIDYQEITPLAKQYGLIKTLPIAEKVDKLMNSIILGDLGEFLLENK